LTNVAVPVGLALHKVPEGLALGWIARRTVPSHWKAALAGSSVEILTVVGALIEPRANTAGAATFGPWWSATVLAVIAGGFLFLGLHAVLPNWRRLGVVAVFVVTLLLVGMIRE
jgi:zinc transporter ZupT